MALVTTVGPCLPSLLESKLDRRLLHEHFLDAPDLHDAFATYAAEAAFFAQVVEPDLRQLRVGATVVEIGAGVGLLARLIAERGFDVIAYEPSSAGFGRMRELSDAVAAAWVPSLEHFSYVRDTSDSAQQAGSIDFAVAINVIEHVPDAVDLVASVTRSLAPGGHARFVCPNYAFPYEPHFNIPTVLHKRATRRLFSHWIEGSEIPDAEAFWCDLSWPTVRQLRASLTGSGVEAGFSRDALLQYVGRLKDSGFVDRKGRVVGTFAAALRPAVQFAASTVPLSLAPIIDLRTQRRGEG